MGRVRYLNLPEARRVYAAGGNVTEYLRRANGLTGNTDEVIEIAYDLQAGSYVADAVADESALDRYTTELAEIFRGYVQGPCSVLDVGSGELTTLSFFARRLENVTELFGFDISWSRLRHGLDFAAARMPDPLFRRTTVFVADIARIPLPAKAVDVVVSSHALEPNGGREDLLLAELLRVARSKLVLFEPSFEVASAEGKERMTRLGYVRDLAGAAARLGATVVATIPLRHVANPLNPTCAYVIEPRAAAPPSGASLRSFTDPGEETSLTKQVDCWFSRQYGLAYPIFQGIPVLVERAGFLASALDRFGTGEP